MRDYLRARMAEPELGALSSLALAHIGDCVYELLVRSYLVTGGARTNRSLHAATIDYVSARAQAQAMEKLLPHLTEQERAVWRRGRNAHVNSIPRRAAVGEYHSATGLECLFGWLYLRGEYDRINTLFDFIADGGGNRKGDAHNAGDHRAE